MARIPADAKKGFWVAAGVLALLWLASKIPARIG